MIAAAMPLLVPIGMEAMVVNHPVQTNVVFHRWEMDYGALATFDDAVPAPFASSGDSIPDPGIHLHWSMPRALTRGIQPVAAAAAQTASGRVTGIAVTGGGFGYRDDAPPAVMVSGGGGAGATATARCSGGIVTGVDVGDPGSGYTSSPQVTIAPSGAVRFPLVPNRWLVVRYGPPSGATAPRPVNAWLLQSDSIDPDGDPAQSNSFVDPFTGAPGAPQATRIGAVPTVLESWQGESAGGKLFLRAVGPGDATFAAYQPGLKNVFAFYDPIAAPGASWSDPKAEAAAADFPEHSALTYSIVGWYSDPAQDPLFGPITAWDEAGDPIRSRWSGADDPLAAWQDLLGDLGWAADIGGAAAADLPSRSLYHSMVFGIDWQTTAVPPRPNATTDQMTVAVGNTSIDALSALVAQLDDATDAEHLEAFQYGALQTIDAPDHEAQIDLLVRGAAFGSVPGGTLWRIVPADGGGSAGGLDPGASPSAPEPTAAQAAALAALNLLQRQQDSDVRELRSRQRDVYSTWWKSARLAAMSSAELAAVTEYLADTPSGIDTIALLQTLLTQNLGHGNPDGAVERAITLAATVRQRAGSLPDPTDAAGILAYATHTLGLDSSELQLKPRAETAFCHPADPVVLIAGIETSDRQGPLVASGTLSCRLGKQAVTGVNVQNGADSVAVTAATAGIAAAIAPAPSSPHLPAEVAAGIEALHVESFFVDATLAATIVAIGLDSTDSSVIHALAAAMREGTAQISTVGSPLSVTMAFTGWTEQAWSPLFLQWDVSWYPTMQDTMMQGQTNWPFAPIETDPAKLVQDGWVFNGTDFDWYGERPANKLDYLGRTLLTPQSTHVLIAQLRKYMDQHPDPDLAAVQTLIDHIGEWNFLSQRLSGLLDQMIMRDLGPTPLPEPAIAAIVGDQYDDLPDPSRGQQDYSFGEGQPVFFPMRGGFLSFNRLVVVDAFGQSVDLMEAHGNVGKGVPFAPVRGEGLAPMAATRLTQPAELVQLSPRPVQGGRLDVRFVSATDDSRDIDIDPTLNPVCGWVLPNHLDGALMVYDSDGNALGELLVLADRAGSPSVRWLPAPDGAHAIEDPATIANAHLAGFVTGLTATTDKGESFRALLDVIDSTLWTIDPLGARADQDLSVLIGRPLALVRAMFDLTLAGAPLANESWGETLQGATADVEIVPIPLRLGSLDLYDDGLLGYFAHDSYASFHSVHSPEDPAPAGYIEPIGAGNYLTLAFDPKQPPALLTLLMDPRGALHAFTGILPTRVVRLPDAYTKDALACMAVTFRAGPILTDRAAVTIPRPTERSGSWSWVGRTRAPPPKWTNADWIDPAGWKVEPIAAADARARPTDVPPRLIEGWLKLDPKPSGP